MPEYLGNVGFLFVNCPNTGIVNNSKTHKCGRFEQLFVLILNKHQQMGLHNFKIIKS